MTASSTFDLAVASSSGSPPGASHGRGAIGLDGVGLQYKSGTSTTNALENLALTIAPERITAFVGPSGCGKSSIVKLISGLIRPTSGRLTVSGQPITGTRSDVGIAFQNPTLMPWRTVLQNILISVEVSAAHRAAYRKDSQSFRSRASGLLNLVGLAGQERARPWELSGGMQQRVSLCRALIHEPQILLLDEPFAALDAFTREDLWGVVQNLFLARKPTIVLITHDLREAVYLADRILVMGRRPGRIVEDVAVTFERPRSLETLFEPAFVDQVHYLRDAISRVMR